MLTESRNIITTALFVSSSGGGAIEEALNDMVPADLDTRLRKLVANVREQ